MGAIVNRELKQRVRPVNGIVAHRPVAKADIKHAAKIIQNLDHKWNIWEENDEKQDKEKTVSVSMATISHNAFLVSSNVQSAEFQVSGQFCVRLQLIWVA